jgi:transglutaminase-like putative cysteine protease
VEPTAQPDAVRHVSSTLELAVVDRAVLALQVAASPLEAVLQEALEVTIDGAGPTVPVREIAAAAGRVHLVTSGPGLLRIRYEASVAAGPTQVAPAPAGTEESTPEVDGETLLALLPSRYCPSDALAGYASVEFDGIARGADLAAAVATWVFERLAYEPGSSGPLDTALHTLVANAGVCRDFAHLTIGLCRALGVPARLVAVYAPGLSPMDFHAVVETRWTGGWEILDPTRLAPRSSLVRVATGRDAADTAFLTTLHGEAELLSSEVFAIVEGDLPADDHHKRTALA